MKIITPIEITESNLFSSNIPETDAPLWDVATEYADKAKVIFAHAVYESLEAGNLGNQPDQDSARWLRLGATNRYKAFDKRISDRAALADQVTYTIAHAGALVSGVAVFGIAGATLEIEVTDPIDGIVFSKTYGLFDDAGVVDWHTYFFSPVGVQREEVIEIEIPPYLNASTRITVTNTGGIAEVGQIAIGRVLDLGVTAYGTSISIEDYSRKERDAFGNAIIVERAFAQLIDYSLKVTTQAARRLQSTLAEYRAIPVVWIGSTTEELGTLVYGYYRRFDIVLAGPTVSDASIEVEGLI
jgi:hypothetical protein